MNKVVTARVQWLPAEGGGRKAPPTSPYSTVARFEEAADAWPGTAWSIVVEFAQEVTDPLETVATVRFLVPDAPEALLHPGSKFEILEGARMVGRGEVLGSIG